MPGFAMAGEKTCCVRICHGVGVLRFVPALDSPSVESFERPLAPGHFFGVMHQAALGRWTSAPIES